MRISRRLALSAVLLILAGCSSSPERSPQGTLAIRLGLSGREAAPAPAGVAARVTLAGFEARREDGTWVSSECDPPDEVDLVALGTGAVTLPPHLLPEGSYNALLVRFSRVELTLEGGKRVALSPPPTGWVELLPVDFGLAFGEPTVVALNVRTDLSFKFSGGKFEFEPVLDVAGIARGPAPSRRSAL